MQRKRASYAIDTIETKDSKESDLLSRALFFSPSGYIRSVGDVIGFTMAVLLFHPDSKFFGFAFLFRLALFVRQSARLLFLMLAHQANFVGDSLAFHA